MNPDDAPPRPPRYWLAVHGVARGVVLIVLVFGVPRIARIFADFGIPLWRFTAEVLHAFRSRTLSTVIVLAVFAVDYVVLNQLARRNDAARFRLWANGMLAAAGIVVLVILAAAAPPFLFPPQNLSG